MADWDDEDMRPGPDGTPKLGRIIPIDEPKKPNGGNGGSPAAHFILGDRKQILKGNPFNIKLAIAKLGLALRQNEFSACSEIFGLPEFGPELDDPGAIRLRLLIEEIYHFLPTQQLFDQVLTDLAFLDRYHPVRDWLASLVWDGVPRIDNWLRDYGGAEDTPFNRAAGRLWLIAGVRRVRQPGVKFDQMLVLESPQGRDKSRALRALAIHDKWFSDDFPLDIESQDLIERTSGVWIVESAELSGIGHRDINHLKSLISRQEERARPAYGRRSQRVPRQFILAGSTNSREYLPDEENRRFWPVAIIKFDTDRLARDAPQLWAEAARAESLNDSIILPQNLWGVAAEVQNARKPQNPFVGILSDALGNGDGWVPSEHVWQILEIKPQDRSRNSLTMGDAMRELGFTKRQARGGLAGIERGKTFYERGACRDEYGIIQDTKRIIWETGEFRF